MKKLYDILKEQVRGKFSVTVPFTQVVADENLEGKALVVFDIEEEYRSWGLKGIELSVLSVVLFYDSGEEKELNLDEYEIVYDWVDGSVYTVEALDINSDRGKIVVRCSYIIK